MVANDFRLCPWIEFSVINVFQVPNAHVNLSRKICIEVVSHDTSVVSDPPARIITSVIRSDVALILAWIAPRAFPT